MADVASIRIIVKKFANERTGDADENRDICRIFSTDENEATTKKPTSITLSRNRSIDKSEWSSGGYAIIGIKSQIESPVKYPKLTSASIIIVSS